eukprot:c23799_g1_i2 orf=91-1074(+)
MLLHLPSLPLTSALPCCSHPHLSRVFCLLEDDCHSAHLQHQQKQRLLAAVGAAAMRMHAGRVAKPLINDPYAASLVALIPDAPNGDNSCNFDGHHYEIATRFIDDSLLDTVKQDNAVRQVVLLSDGMDTRPYRLPWPPNTLIFDVSFDAVFKLAREQLLVSGAKVPKMCLFRHVSAEPVDWERWSLALKEVGYQGDKPSVWVLQGLDHLTSGLQDILTCVSSLAMKGAFVFGELPLTALDTAFKDTGKQQLEEVFMGQGFKVKTVSYHKIAQEYVCTQYEEFTGGGFGKRFLFVAQQLRLSDDQVAKARREIEIAEEAGDEDTFEDW